MTPFIDETPIATILEQSFRYTKRQMLILHGDLLSDEVKRPSKAELISLYERIQRAKDENALDILERKYDISSLLGKDETLLPQSTLDEANATFEMISNYINSVNPYVKNINDKKD